MAVSGPRVEDDALGRDDYLMRNAVDPVPVADGRIVRGVEVDPCDAVFLGGRFPLLFRIGGDADNGQPVPVRLGYGSRFRQRLKARTAPERPKVEQNLFARIFR